LPSNVSELIQSLKRSKLIAECPHCEGEFQLSKSLLFDGRKKFPVKAEEIRLDMQKELEERISDLKELQKRAHTSSERAAISVGVGKNIEQMLPAHKNFNLITADCRFLGEPIDIILFDGVSEDKIKRITFMDVKTGNASLNDHQKMIRDAINDHDVGWRAI